jgi:hypothetical protein
MRIHLRLPKTASPEALYCERLIWSAPRSRAACFRTARPHSAEFQILEQSRLRRAADEAGDRAGHGYVGELRDHKEDNHGQADADRELTHRLGWILKQLPLEEEDGRSFHHLEHIGGLSEENSGDGEADDDADRAGERAIESAEPGGELIAERLAADRDAADGAAEDGKSSAEDYRGEPET